MKKKINKKNNPIGKIKIVDDFLPPPEELALKEDNIKVTMSLSRASIIFFKKEAQKNKTKYQKMIRNLIDAYVDHHQARPGL